MTQASTADFVVVANRLPVDMETAPDGSTRWRRSPGGLVTALEPILRHNAGAWVGWPGISDVEVDPLIEDGLQLHPVALDADDFEDYYEGFSNATLWPLYHDLVVKPAYHRHWWQSYQQVNRKFAEATAAVAAPGATVWVQDYQLQLVPALLRALRPDLTIGLFLHIPFPPAELFMQLPWRRALVEGMLGADLIGFQLPGGADNFRVLVRDLLGLPVSRRAIRPGNRTGTIDLATRTVHVGAFPISTDSAALDRSARSRAVQRRAAELRTDLGAPQTLLLGVDRLDYTKGIDVRLRALEELLAEGRLDPQQVCLVQIATPSRERVDHYDVQRRAIEQQVGRINGEFSTFSRPLVHYIHRSVGKSTLAALYAASDVMLVTPLRDGMNLVAKEYVACRTKVDGALVLSEFAGAAKELRQAYLVNPHDLNQVKDAIVAAIEQSPTEARRRMRPMRRQVLTHDVARWARNFLTALGRAADRPVIAE